MISLRLVAKVVQQCEVYDMYMSTEKTEENGPFYTDFAVNDYSHC